MEFEKINLEKPWNFFSDILLNQFFALRSHFKYHVHGFVHFIVVSYILWLISTWNSAGNPVHTIVSNRQTYGIDSDSLTQQKNGRKLTNHNIEVLSWKYTQSELIKQFMDKNLNLYM